MAGYPSNSFDTARITHRVVSASEIDELGHVNNAVYVGWVQDAAVEHWEFAANNMLKEKFIWMCSRHEIDYRAQLFLGDEVIVRTWLGGSKGARFERYVEFGKVGLSGCVASVKTTWILVNRASGKPIRVPDEILNAFELS